MRIIVDSQLGHKCIKKCLKVGDYSIEGKESSVAIERKSLPDFVSSITRDRKRFERELEKARSYKFFAVVIEGSFKDIKTGNYPSDTNRKSILATINKWMVKYTVPIILANSREEAALTTLHMLEAAKDYGI